LDFYVDYRGEVRAVSASIKGEFTLTLTLFSFRTPIIMEVVIDYEYLTGARGEEVPKEVSVASEKVIDSFRFLPPTP
jgi:hypothetical protein